MDLSNFDIQGHRGCRGLMPENTIPGFLKAIDLGVTTLEMDVVATQDNQIILSHEAYMSSRICLDSLGQEIAEADEKSFNIFEMTYEEVMRFDCGSKPVTDFPEQEKAPAFKPLLSEVIMAVEAYVQKNGLPPVAYNIELKSNIKTDGLFHPDPSQFVQLVLPILQQSGILDRTTIQSFDFRILHAFHSIDPQIKTTILVENSLGVEKNLNDVGYNPTIYSPQDILVNESMIRILHSRGILVIPWTINDEEEMRRLIDLGVDGIISDYPDRLVKVVKELSGG